MDRRFDTEFFSRFSSVPPKAHPKGIPPPSSSPTPLHLLEFSANDLPPQAVTLNKEPP